MEKELLHLICTCIASLEGYWGTKGPVYGFWLFSFEHYNGLLGHQPSSNHCIESQLMHCFLQDQMVFTSEYSDDFAGDFRCFFTQTERLSGFVLQTVALTTSYTLPTRCKRNVLDEDLVKDLSQLICKMHSFFSPDTVYSIYLSWLVITTYTSKSARHLNSFTVLAKWDSNLYVAVQFKVCCIHYIVMYFYVSFHHYMWAGEGLKYNVTQFKSGHCLLSGEVFRVAQ